ncbi:hypothetical protein [Desmonostoc muscorum]|uniref:hypothetical protein n=1 Tax=Desmonostoc muscorum TaxID=1179 RepID=UPI001F22A8E2|nr:hypothetical protein [Desmonostoc muscorum]
MSAMVHYADANAPTSAIALAAIKEEEMKSNNFGELKGKSHLYQTRPNTIKLVQNSKI